MQKYISHTIMVPPLTKKQYSSRKNQIKKNEYFLDHLIQQVEESDAQPPLEKINFRLKDNEQNRNKWEYFQSLLQEKNIPIAGFMRDCLVTYLEK